MIILWNRGIAKAVSGATQHRRYAYALVYSVPVGGGGASIVPIVMYYRENGIL